MEHMLTEAQLADIYMAAEMWEASPDAEAAYERFLGSLGPTVSVTLEGYPVEPQE